MRYYFCSNSIMTRSLSFILLFVSPFFSIGQNNQQLRETLGLPSSDCEAISVISQAELIKLDFTQTEEIERIAEEWANICSYNEGVFRLHVLLSIQSDTLIEGEIGKNVDYFIENFQDRARESRFSRADEIYAFDKAYYVYIPLNSAFDKWIARWAKALLKEPQSDFEHLFLSLYADTNPYYYEDNIYNERYNSVKRITDRREKDRKESFEEAHIQLLLGTWIPTGPMANHFGPSASFGLSLLSPIFNEDWRIQGGANFHFPTNLKEFRINTLDSTEHTTSSVIINFNVDGVRELIVNKKIQLRFIAGIGLDIVDTNVERPVDEEGEDEPGDYSIFTYNLHTGFDLGFRTKSYHYWGIRTLLNVVDYNIGLRAADELGGNTFSVMLYYQF